MDKVSTKKDKEVEVWGGDLLSGYELSMNNEPVCIIDILENAIWMKNDVSADEKLIFSSIASAILLKRVKDVDNDKTAL